MQCWTIPVSTRHRASLILVYCDVEFIFPARSSRRSEPGSRGGSSSPRRIYAAKKLLTRCEYFHAMFTGGFREVEGVIEEVSPSQSVSSDCRTRTRTMMMFCLIRTWKRRPKLHLERRKPLRSHSLPLPVDRLPSLIAGHQRLVIIYLMCPRRNLTNREKMKTRNRLQGSDTRMSQSKKSKCRRKGTGCLVHLPDIRARWSVPRRPRW